MDYKDIFDKAMRVLQDTYNDVYTAKDDTLTQLSPETRVISGLGIDRIDSAFALDWRARAAKGMGVNENDLPDPVKGKDYRVAELADMLVKARRTHAAA